MSTAAHVAFASYFNSPEGEDVLLRIAHLMRQKAQAWSGLLKNCEEENCQARWSVCFCSFGKYICGLVLLLKMKCFGDCKPTDPFSARLVHMRSWVSWSLSQMIWVEKWGTHIECQTLFLSRSTFMLPFPLESRYDWNYMRKSGRTVYSTIVSVRQWVVWWQENA